MKKALAVTAALAVLCLSSAASAAITIDTVRVGDPGNIGEMSGVAGGGNGPDRICGAVGYIYNIGRFEVTGSQYCEFLNAVAKTDTYGLYNVEMWNSVYGCRLKRDNSAGSYSYSITAEWANRPVNYVSFWDACRFANWLHNGQPTGAQDASTTERGAYTLDGYNGYDGRAIGRNTDARWAVTSEDEWYKAAYYKGGGTDAGYWDYPTQSDSINAGMANYGWPFAGTVDVGSYAFASAYGTFDQAGNVWERNEGLIWDGYSARGLRGGSFNDFALNSASTPGTFSYYPSDESGTVGFRVVQLIPEPSSIIVLLGGLISLFGLKRRKA